jgi:DNA excision repair protein ERCC-2
MSVVTEQVKVEEEALYKVSVRNLCLFGAKAGDLDLRFTPSPTAQQGREGHMLVASRRGLDHEAEVKLTGQYQCLQISGRADGYDARRNELEEVKTFRGSLKAMAPNHQELHWAQLKVYGWLMCQSRDLASLNLTLVYFDVGDQSEHPVSEAFSSDELRVFFESLCERFLDWARLELDHRQRRDAALEELEFPQLPFRPGQRELARDVYRACVQSRPLLVQAPTGIGKTIGTVFPALRAMPVRGVDKLFFLTAKTPGRQVALEALQKVTRTQKHFPLRVIELVAKDKACEHKDKACHGQSCPLASGFYDRLPEARAAAAQLAWLDQKGLREVALEHQICPYYLGHEMVRWSDVVVGDYNYYFDRTAMLHSLTVDGALRVSVLVDEAHNLYARACSMYSEDLSHAQTLAVRPDVPKAIRGRIDELLNQWQLLLDASERNTPDKTWSLLDEVPEGMLRSLQKFNSMVSEHLNDHPTDTHGALLPYYFKTLSFAGLAEAFGEHTMCEFDRAELALPTTLQTQSEALQLSLAGELVGVPENTPGTLTLRNIVPGHFISTRIKAADSIVLFSATLNPPDYYINLLGLPDTTLSNNIPGPFKPEQLKVSIKPISTRRDDRPASLDALVETMASQFADDPGNYMAFFSSFDYMELAQRTLQQRYPNLPVWSQERLMTEERRQAYLHQFDAAGQGIGFAVLGGVFGEGVDLPGKRLIGAFIATLGLPQFDEVNQAICERMQKRFGRGHDYTYTLPGIQKVVQAAGRVIRTELDTGTVILLDERYLENRYRKLLPDWWVLVGSPRE